MATSAGEREESLGAGGSGIGRGSSHSHPLSHPDDVKFLTGLLCFVRSDLVEAFVVSTDEEAMACRNVDVRRRKGDSLSGRGENDDRVRRGEGELGELYGRVGVRCVHCAAAKNASLLSGEKPRKVKGAARGAVSFPPSIRLVYQTVRNWQRYHAATCPSMPKDVKAKYLALKATSAAKQEKSKIGLGKFWEKSCVKMGMVDAGDGIRLRDGRFLDAPAESVVGRLAYEGMSSVQLSSTMGNEEKKPAMTNFSSQTLPAHGSHQQDAKDQHRQFHSEEFQWSQRMEHSSSEASSRAFQPPAVDPHISEATSTGGTRLVIKRDGNHSTAPVEEELWRSCSPGLLAIVPNEPNARDCSGSPQLGLTTTQTEIISTAVEGGSSLSLGSEQWTRDNGLPDLTGDAILEKVKLAASVVRAVGQVRCLPPTSLGKDDEAVGSGKEYDGFDMRCLGEELYELFAGQNPFQGEEEEDLDEVERKEPANDEELEPVEEGPQQQTKREKRREGNYVPLSEMGLPPAVCSLVSSLLDDENKGQDNRFESVQDVEEDLQLMAARPDRFLFQPANGCLQTASTILFGREKEIAQLLGAYDEMTHSAGVGRKRMVLVAGHSGTGKSSLVHSARDRLVGKGARFISGKFDAMQQLQPLTAIVSALDDYCDMLARDLDSISRVQESIASALGEEGSAALSSLIPNFGKIVKSEGDGKTAGIQARGQATTERVAFLCRMLLRVTCSLAHPVVLFLDDLQWADKVSLDIMQALVIDVGVEGLLVIGCYREDEVNADHLLTAHLDKIRSSKSVDIIPIQVGNLSLSSVNALVSENLCATPRVTRHLAEAVLHKTGGNALFVMQFLVSLHDEGLLRFPLMSKQWDWDIERIRSKSIADNVVELMTAKLLRLAPEVRLALKLAAAFGAQCQEEIFQILDRVPGRVVNCTAALDIAVSEGLVIKIGSAYRFSHDQIQHAAYFLIPEVEVEDFHLKVGRWLWLWSSAKELDDYIFVVIDQLHRGSRLITDHDEEINIASLSLLAGQKASEMHAFLPAATYLKVGISLLAKEDWTVHRDLCFDLYNSAAEAEYIVREFDAMELHVEEVLRSANTLQEKLRAYYALVQSRVGQGNTKGGIGTALVVLNQLDETIPEAVTKLTVMQELMATQNLISEKTEAALFHLEIMKDERKKEVMKILHILSFTLNIQRQELCAVLVCRMVRLSLEYGVCSESAFGFAAYGVLVIGVLKDLSGGYRLGKLALSIQKKFHLKENLARLLVCGIINNWVEPIQSSLPFLKDAIRVGLASGDIYCGTTAALLYLGSALCAGERLRPLMEEMKSLSTLISEYKQFAFHSISKPMQQAVQNLLGESDDPIKLVRDENDENHEMTTGESSQFSAPDALTKLYRMWLEYLFGEYELAWETMEENQGIREWSGGRFPIACMFSFYSGLTAIAMARNEEETKYADTIDKSLAQMKVWAASTSWNCQHKMELMNAEYAYLKRDLAGAAEAYLSAVETAAKHKFIHEEALASERAGLFCSETGAHDAASKMFMRAHKCYNEWGALSKAAHVQEQYGLLIL